jgi:preprotein translocase subunit SecA
LLIQQDEPNMQQAPKQKTNFGRTNAELDNMNEERRRMREAAANAGREPQRPMTIVREDPKVGRNDPCPCGSGKKFKNCHGVGA